MENIKIIKHIGEGSFGAVFLVRYDEHGGLNALKHTHVKSFKQSLPYRSLREMRSLLEMKHPHIVTLCSVFPYKNRLSFFLGYSPVSLDNILFTTDKPLKLEMVKRWIIMLLRGISYCHSKCIIHRDIKPSNLLLSKNGTLKISDFGLARVHHEYRDFRYTSQIATRWYRAPELLFGSHSYSFPIDMWSIGIVFAEMLTRIPLFAGINDINQIYALVQILGKPVASDCNQVNDLPDYQKLSFPQMEHIDWSAIFADCSDDARNWISRCLVFDPEKRITALQSLRSSIFFDTSSSQNVIYNKQFSSFIILPFNYGKFLWVDSGHFYKPLTPQAVVI